MTRSVAKLSTWTATASEAHRAQERAREASREAESTRRHAVHGGATQAVEALLAEERGRVAALEAAKDDAEFAKDEEIARVKQQHAGTAMRALLARGCDVSLGLSHAVDLR